jgi:hypothetical protein
MGPERYGLCGGCKEAHGMQITSLYYYTKLAVPKCAEGAMTNQIGLDVLAAATRTRMNQLFDAASEVAKTL